MIARVCLALAIVACGTDAVPFETPPQCTTDTHWKFGDQGSDLMYPGATCNECHSSHIDTPRFTIAGTVYATGHEPDNCDGAAGAVVEIVDAKGTMLSLESNAAGNFMHSIVDETVVFPISARVILNNEVRAMTGRVADGDCNGCHTQFGSSGAPGRIVLP